MDTNEQGGGSCLLHAAAGASVIRGDRQRWSPLVMGKKRRKNSSSLTRIKSNNCFELRVGKMRQETKATKNPEKRLPE
jgi:hypothetical protein